MGRIPVSAIEAAVTAAVFLGTTWLLSELRDPTSDLRLRLAELGDRMKGATT